MLAVLAEGDVPVPGHIEWSAEEVLEDGSRPGSQGRLPGTDDPVVRIEAKFTAALTDEQLASYSPTPVVVLHPAHRAREVADVIGAAAKPVEGARFASITWDDLFEALTAGLAEGVDQENIFQLRDLADIATGLDVGPFTADASLESVVGDTRTTRRPADADHAGPLVRRRALFPHRTTAVGGTGSAKGSSGRRTRTICLLKRHVVVAEIG